jgi:hypothetical protein
VTYNNCFCLCKFRLDYSILFLRFLYQQPTNSHQSKIGGFLIIALAIDTLCFSESVIPLSLKRSRIVS